MKNLLDYLINSAPEENEGAVEVQVQLRGGMHAGALRVCTFDSEIYELTSMMVDKQNNPKIIKVFFSPEAVDAVMLAVASDTPQIAVPRGGLILPGAH